MAKVGKRARTDLWGAASDGRPYRDGEPNGASSKNWQRHTGKSSPWASKRQARSCVANLEVLLALEVQQTRARARRDKCDGRASRAHRRARLLAEKPQNCQSTQR